MTVDRPSPRLRLATTAFMAIGLIGVVAGGCQRAQLSPSPSDSPGVIAQGSQVSSAGTSMEPAPSEIAATPLVTASATPATKPSLQAATQIAVDSAVWTVTDRLRVRGAPGVSSASEKLEPLLDRRTLLFVMAGPISADGYEWYQVTPFVATAPTGWVAAAGHDGTPWLAPADLACPTPPIDVRNVPDPFGFGGLVCFGGREVQISGLVTCLLGDEGSSFTGPEWIRTDRHCNFDVDGQAIAFFDGGIEGLGLPTQGPGVVTGHFDDPEAPACRWTGEFPIEPSDFPWVVVSCRAMFVATELN